MEKSNEKKRLPTFLRIVPKTTYVQIFKIFFCLFINRKINFMNVKTFKFPDLGGFIFTWTKREFRGENFDFSFLKLSFSSKSETDFDSNSFLGNKLFERLTLEKTLFGNFLNFKF